MTAKGSDLYAYCEGDPVNKVDRNGEYGLWRADVKKLNKSKYTSYGKAPSQSYLKKNQTNWLSANCFGYAIRVNRNLKLIAGMEKISASKTKNVDCWFNAVVNYIKKYKLARWVRRLTGPYARIYSDEWRVALRCSTRSSNGYEDYQTYDYHFMIQQSNGNWSDKHSETNTVHYDHTSLSEVKTWSGTYPNNDKMYDSKIVYFAVCNKKPKGA